MPVAPPVSRKPGPPSRNGAPVDKRRPSTPAPSGRAVPAGRSAPVAGAAAAKDKPEPEILFQKFFKSIGPRTYAAQVKRASTGNHFLVLTEGKRDDATGEVRKNRVMIFSEDFPAMFRMLHETAQFIKANPVPEEVRRKREKFWAKKAEEESGAPAGNRAGRS
jgi:hypothetical protein